MIVLVIQSCPTLYGPVDCSPPGSSVHGILQARILEWVAILFSRGSSWPRNRTQVSCIADGFFTIWAIREGLVLSSNPEYHTLKTSPLIPTIRNYPRVAFPFCSQGASSCQRWTQGVRWERGQWALRKGGWRGRKLERSHWPGLCDFSKSNTNGVERRMILSDEKRGFFWSLAVESGYELEGDGKPQDF